MPLIAIAGASGSGKTTVSKKLLAHYGAENCVIISADNYYKDLTHLPLNERTKVNFDHPQSIDFDLLAKQLAELKQGCSINIPEYDFSTHSRKKTTLLCQPKKYIILEGILILHAEQLKKLIDYKIFVKTRSDLALIRRIERDEVERGRSFKEGITHYKSTVRSMFDKYVKPSQEDADLIIENNSDNFIFDLQKIINLIENGSKNKSPKTSNNLFKSRTTLGFHTPPSIDIHPEKLTM